MTVAHTTDFATCACGSVWFNLIPGTSAAGRAEGALTFDVDGSVAAYSGHLCCVECRTAYPTVTDLPARPPTLRLFTDPEPVEGTP